MILTLRATWFNLLALQTSVPTVTIAHREKALLYYSLFLNIHSLPIWFWILFHKGFANSLVLYVVSYGEGIAWSKRPIASMVAQQIVDYMCMFFNALIPLVISFLRAKSE